MSEEYEYAKRLAVSLREQHWPENTGWEPLPDLMGVLTQIDNMSTLMRDQAEQIFQLRSDEEMRIVQAYRRGADWMRENPDCSEFLSKASYDYADKVQHT